jgi:hypothetical protein
MARYSLLGLVVAAVNICWAMGIGANAQALPSPPLKPCHDLHVSGKMDGLWESRRDAQHPGRFEVTIDLSCSDSGTEIYNLEIHPQELTDTKLNDVVYGKSVDYVASIGQAATPTVFIAGNCGQPGSSPDPNCKFWLMFVDNGQRAKDLVAFLVSDGTGQRLAYGAGPIDVGDVSISGVE